MKPTILNVLETVKDLGGYPTVREIRSVLLGDDVSLADTNHLSAIVSSSTKNGWEYLKAEKPCQGKSKVYKLTSKGMNYIDQGGACSLADRKAVSVKGMLHKLVEANKYISPAYLAGLVSDVQQATVTKRLVECFWENLVDRERRGASFHYCANNNTRRFLRGESMEGPDLISDKSLKLFHQVICCYA